MNKELGRDRVRQFRQRQAQRGRVRVELYLPEEMAAGVATHVRASLWSLSIGVRWVPRAAINLAQDLAASFRYTVHMYSSRVFWSHA